MSKSASMHASAVTRVRNDGSLVPSRKVMEIKSELGSRDSSSEVVCGVGGTHEISK
jgi:hypothetical protein